MRGFPNVFGVDGKIFLIIFLGILVYVVVLEIQKRK
jgi:hypothetical protein